MKTNKEYLENPKYICELGHLLPSQYDECPICQSVVEKATICSKCGEWTWEEDVDNGWCVDCQNELVEKFKEMTKPLTRKERNYIFDFLDFLEWQYLGEE